ncbi:CopD family protein [Alcanivorax sp. JB21]|uniref:CopD family protein n=1 Tax=Alcanivorax limicola TaxID=2874102 RepID=UPI001CBDAF74|nr:CopD family protein [Alcanivorax limicola]MBZ2188340.1 CopD family protein [Alcanivorax limicola]
MPWLKILHITTLGIWCGALLYLPALIAACDRAQRGTQAADAALVTSPGLPRRFFTLVATPAALLAIISGSLLFAGVLDIRVTSLTQHDSLPSFPAWLLAKLLLVAGMVLCHAFCGWLIQRSELHAADATAGASRTLTLLCALTASLTTLLILLVLYLVLAKPL